MEMTPDMPRREPLPGDPPQASALGLAAAALRRRADERWVEVSDRVVSRAMTVTRRSQPIRAQASTGPIQVSEQVVIPAGPQQGQAAGGARTRAGRAPQPDQLAGPHVGS